MATNSVKAPKLAGQGSVDLPGDVFSESFHEALVHECARAEQLARRSGTAATKTRGQVRGGGAKPWRQKGTGRARAGSIRAPHWDGGGVVFGPSPRSYTVKVNRKARRRALRSALSAHAERGSIAVIDPAKFEQPSTSAAAKALDDWQAERPLLLILGSEEHDCWKSFRNLPDVYSLPAGAVGVADLMAAASLVASPTALDALARMAKEASE